LYPRRTSAFNVGRWIGRYVWATIWSRGGDAKVQGRELPCKQGAERWKADTDYANIDFDYGPESGVYVVFGEALAAVQKNMLLKWMLREEEH
jgi:hypothetical protein